VVEEALHLSFDQGPDAVFVTRHAGGFAEPFQQVDVHGALLVVCPETSGTWPRVTGLFPACYPRFTKCP